MGVCYGFIFRAFAMFLVVVWMLGIRLVCWIVVVVLRVCCNIGDSILLGLRV